jgi:Fe-Mn family superoxide dismutase
MSILLSKLPYSLDALEPHVSEKTLGIHYERHHQGYVDKLNKLIAGTSYEKLSLEDIIRKARKSADIDVLNNAAQTWNHAFFWKSMSPNGGKPDGRIKDAVEARFKDVTEFKRKFRDAATGLFGSGWVWLLLDRGQIRIVTTGNADTPAGTELTPLITLDVWEHAYYLDYQNERGRFIDAYLDNLINWNFAAANLEAAEARKAA